MAAPTSCGGQRGGSSALSGKALAMNIEAHVADKFSSSPMIPNPVSALSKHRVIYNMLHV